MIGQERLLAQLQDLSLLTFKTPVLLLGPLGCGKHLLATELANKFNVDLISIEDTSSIDALAEYKQCPVNKLYLINLSNFTEKQQNQILKFIEEPSSTNFIILIAESEFGILSTVLSRCKKYHFDTYSKEELQAITKIDLDNLPENIYNICKTPGQLLNCNYNQVGKLYNYCSKILSKYNSVSIEHLLSISTKVNYKEEYDKYDFTLFFNTLLQIAAENYLASKTNKTLKVYLFIDKYLQKLQVKTLTKENFLVSFLFELTQIV